jgi:hypothetical protein
MAHDTCTLDVAELVPLLERQRTLYRRLRLLADRQKLLVVQDDAQALLDLVGERQVLVDRLVEVSGQLAPYRSEWTEIYTRLGEPGRRQVAELLEEANRALSSILQSDSRDTAVLSARRESASRHLSAMESGSRATAAYSRAGATAREILTDATA